MLIFLQRDQRHPASFVMHLTTASSSENYNFAWFLRSHLVTKYTVSIIPYLLIRSKTSCISFRCFEKLYSRIFSQVVFHISHGIQLTTENTLSQAFPFSSKLLLSVIFLILAGTELVPSWFASPEIDLVFSLTEKSSFVASLTINEFHNATSIINERKYP